MKRNGINILLFSLVILFTFVFWPKKPTETLVIENKTTQDKKNTDLPAYKPERPQLKSLQDKKTLLANYSSLTPKNPTAPVQLESDEEGTPSLEVYESTFDKALAEGYGESPAVSEDNPQVQSVEVALKEGGHPERLSPLIRPKAFNLSAYTSDEDYRKKYLETAEYGRVFQSLNPEKGTPKTTRKSPYYQQVAQGDTVNLSLQAAPNMPVTFTSFDLGKFSNGLTTQTVEADSSGYAEVEFHGMSGTIGDVNILASSPAASGQVKFLVYTKFNNKGNISEK
jgi:hypothetical protein